MIDIIKDTLIDALKLLPFLFFAFLIIEIVEHKLSKKSLKIISKSDKYGPIVGSALGLIPQCGFSVMATNLYITRIITLGTLISIYLSTSDEMIPILISNRVAALEIIKILFIKFIIGLIFGIIIDMITRKKYKNNYNYDICENEHCDCSNGIFKSVIKHTINTMIFILIVTFILNYLLEYASNEFLSKIFLKNSILAPFLTSLIGLIPNCCSSVILTELYVNSAISFSSLISGLLTGSGVALLVLFKTNKNLKENFKILGIIYGCGVLSGIFIQILSIIFDYIV